MAKMNWDRVNAENLLARWIKKSRQTDARTEERPVRSIGAAQTTADMRVAARRFIKQLDDREFGKIESEIEKWIRSAPAREIYETVKSLGEDAEYLFMLIVEKMTRRQREMQTAFEKLAQDMEASNARRMRKSKKKLNQAASH